MAASKRFLLAKATQRRQTTLNTRAKEAGMPQVIKTPLWERARSAYFGDRPLTHKERIKAQMPADVE